MRFVSSKFPENADVVLERSRESTRRESACTVIKEGRMEGMMESGGSWLAT